MKSTLSMVWHIFKKDCRLLWPFILGVAGVQFALAAVRYLMDHGGETETLSALFYLLQQAMPLAIVLLIATAVHQDAIPGVRQDWLVRPVRRRDLLLAKLLFVLVMVQGPILLADTGQALVNGFPLGQSLASAVRQGLVVLILPCLPALAFSSLMRNMTDTVIGAVLLVVGVVAANQFSRFAQLPSPPTQGTGLAWIAQSLSLATVLLGAGVILTLQYFRRKTVLARWLTVGIACSAMLVQFVPWQSAFALQQRLSPAPGASRLIVATYEPSLGKFPLPEGISHKTVSSGATQRDEASTVYLPVHIAGLPDDALLNADKAQVSLLADNSKAVFRGPADDLLIRRGPVGPFQFSIGSRSARFVRQISSKDLSVPQDGGTWVYQGLALPRRLYERIKNQPLRLEIDYSLTLWQPKGNSQTIPALGGNQVLPGVGRCTTKMDDDGDDINLSCMQTGVPPSCASVFLEHVPSGRRNPASFFFAANYSPYLLQEDSDGIARFGAGVRFHDLTGLAKYPVDSSQLPESRVVIRVYQAQDHFTRRLVIPNIRLSDWESVEHNQVAESH
jgi:hypothetical protein